jgi:hypothetical protein
MSYYNQYPTRKAILIGCPGSGDSFLGGVKQDLENVSKYLQSEKGGVWYEDEIKPLYNPTYSQVQQVIKNAIADYVVVYFSGHGYTDTDNNARMICLKDYNISDKNLLNNSHRQLVLIDACRNEVGQGISGVPDFEPQWEYFTGSPVRELFDNYIKNSPAGKLIVHGTQRGEYSYDSSTGGMFTNALLNIGTRIKADQKYTQASISTVLNYVPRILQPQDNYQIPSIAYRTGNLTVPFAIGVPKYNLPQTKRTVPQRQLATTNNTSSGGGWLALGLGLLVLGIATSGKK